MTRYIGTTKIEGVLNGLVSGMARVGLPLAGSRVLEVRGRTTGEWRSTPVNPMRFRGERYLVAARGHTHWVRNLRTAGVGRLVAGRRTEEFRAEEVPDADKPPILRAYLKAWGWEVGRFVEGLTAASSEEEFARAAPGFPVFRLRPADHEPR